MLKTLCCIIYLESFLVWVKLQDRKLKMVSIGSAGVWGVNSEDQIFYRTGTYKNPNRFLIN